MGTGTSNTTLADVTDGNSTDLEVLHLVMSTWDSDMISTFLCKLQHRWRLRAEEQVRPGSTWCSPFTLWLMYRPGDYADIAAQVRSYSKVTFDYASGLRADL